MTYDCILFTFLTQVKLLLHKEIHSRKYCSVTISHHALRGYIPSRRSLASPGSAPVERTNSDRTVSISTVM